MSKELTSEYGGAPRVISSHSNTPKDHCRRKMWRNTQDGVSVRVHNEVSGKILQYIVIQKCFDYFLTFESLSKNDLCQI